MKSNRTLHSDKTVCAYCGKATEFLLLDSEDGHSLAFCSWEHNLRFLACRDTDLIAYPVPEIKSGRCTICGNETGEEFCDDCMDTAFIFLTAIMKAKVIDDIAVAWSTWHNNFPPRKGTKMFLDNCQQCGKIIWIHNWERTKNSSAGKYCCSACHIEFQKGIKATKTRNI